MTVEYNDVISNKLGYFSQPEEDYKLGQDIQLKGEDAKIFKELYSVTPPKKGKDINTAGSKCSGNGEIALYWLLNKNYKVEDGRGGGSPDLIINTIGIEVKAYNNKKITLGKFSSDKENLALLNTLFGLHSLVTSLDKNIGKNKEANAFNFSRGDIIKAFGSLRDFSLNKELRDLSTKYSIIKNIYDKTDELMFSLKLPSNFETEDASSIMIKKLIFTKIKEKPGEGGYMVNISECGKIKWNQITQDKLFKADARIILNNSAINQAQIIINLDAIF